MTGSIIASAVAYLNLSKAKKAYEEAVLRYRNLLSTYQAYIDNYEKNKEVLDIVKIGRQEDGSYAEPLPNVEISFTLQVGKIGGKKMAAQTIVKIKNNSNKTLRLKALQLKMATADGLVDFANGGGEVEYVPAFSNSLNGADVVILPGNGHDMDLFAIPQASILSKSKMSEFRKYVAGLYGKRLYTSLLPFGYAYPVAKAMIATELGIQYVYQLESGEWVAAQSIWRDIYGGLQYMGDSWLPVTLPIGKLILRALTFHISDIFYIAVENKKDQDKFKNSYNG